MAAPIGNNYWQFRNKHGKDPDYNPSELWDEFVQYCQWIEENPLHEEKQFAFQGMVTIHEAPKMRAMTIRGFCLFADISMKTSSADNRQILYVLTTQIIAKGLK